MFHDLQGLLISLLLIVVTGAAYAPVRGNHFVNLDDEQYITRNRMVQDGLTSKGLAWAWTTFHASNWHPLTWMSLQLDATLCRLRGGGLNATVFHLMNLFWHSASVVLLFVVLRRMTGVVWRSALVAALFAVHPLHVESVAWAAERKDVLSTFFWILTLGLYAWYVEGPTWGRYLLMALAFILGLLAKPMLVTLPFVLLLLDYWPFQRLRLDGTRTPFLRLLEEKLPLFALAGISCLMTLIAQDQGGAVQTLESVPVPVRIANALVAYIGYLGKTFWPLNLAVFYPHPLDTIPVWQSAAAGVLLGGITGLVLWGGRRWPYLLVGWLWFVGTLVPVIGLVQVGDQAMADRYTYVPHIGLFIALVWGLSDLLAGIRVPGVARVSLAVAALAACVVLTRTQVGHWRNTITLWEHTLRITTRNYRGEASLGYELYEQGKQTNDRKKLRQAVEHLEAALKLNNKDLELTYGLAEALLLLGKNEEAVKWFQVVLQIDGRHAAAHFNLGLAYLRLQQPDDAQRHFAEAARYKPDLADAHNTLGWLHLQKGELEEATPCFTAALQQQPRHSRALQGRGLIALRRGKVEEARKDLLQAIESDPNSSEAHTFLADVQAEAGQFDEAVRTAEKALELARPSGPAIRISQIEERIRRYQDRQPYRENDR